jgi:predicted flap endonuclease-1-like 5' DNA nuclease
MNERFTSDLVFILVVLIVAALLGFFIGYLIRRYKHLKLSELENEIDQLKIKLDDCRHEKQALLSELEANQGIVFDGKAAASALGYKVVQDDLKIVEGIGEKIDSILKSRGIDTWLKLSQADAVHVKEILLEVGGQQYNIHEPKTWPQQALLAHEGKWVELKKLQDELKGGRLQ